MPPIREHLQASLYVAARYLGVGFFLIVLASCQSSPQTATPANSSTDVAGSTEDTDQPTAIETEPKALPPPPPTNSYLAHLSPEVANQLVNLDINIAIPTYLPQTMTLANYRVGEAAGNPYYWLVYRDAQDRCFAIEYTAGEREDIFLENQESLKSGLFGDDYRLYHGKFPNGGDGELPESDLFTDWLEGQDGAYRLVGAGLVNAQDNEQENCGNIAIQEAIAVAESLSYLPTDIKTLDRFSTGTDVPE